jgi:hypothetical protein
MYEKKKKQQKRTDGARAEEIDGDNGGMPKASLRDAIEVLLQTTPSNRYTNSFLNSHSEVGNTYQQERSDGKADNDNDVAQILRELEGLLLDQSEDFDDEDDDESQTTSDAITFATMLLDNRYPNGKGSIPRDLVVKARHSEDTQILEIYGLRSSSNSPSSRDISTWDDEDEDCAVDVVYTREPGYQDHIPDITAQVYQLNGNIKLRYSAALEDEIYQRFRRPNPGYYYEDDEDDFDS